MKQRPVRWVKDAETAEAKCDICRQWFPLTREFWRPGQGLSRCSACWAVYYRVRQRGYNVREADKEAKRERNRVYYAANRERVRATNRAWRERNKEHYDAYLREWRAKNRAELAEKSRAYYAEAREIILSKKRARYRGEEAA